MKLLRSRVPAPKTDYQFLLHEKMIQFVRESGISLLSLHLIEQRSIFDVRKNNDIIFEHMYYHFSDGEGKYKLSLYLRAVKPGIKNFGELHFTFSYRGVVYDREGNTSQCAIWLQDFIVAKELRI